MKSTIDIVYRVWDDKLGVKIEVGPDGDALYCVQVSTEDDPSRDHFGAWRVVMDPEFARKLGSAIIKCADDLDAARKAEMDVGP